MGHHKEYIEKIKEALPKTKHLTDEEKTNTMKHIEEWLAEDEADGYFIEKLSELSINIKPFLQEIGLA